MSTTTATTTSPSPSTSSSSALLTSLRRDGYVLIPSLLPYSLLQPLRRASAHLTSLAREGTWPHARTVPKQFPPWPSTPPPPETGGIWGVQHLLHPSCPSREIFAQLYFSDAVLSVVKALLALPDDEHGDEGLVMELFNLLVSPTGNVDFALRWHRDDIPISASLSREEEEKLLSEKSPNGKQAHAQYNIALFDDASLVVVPGSHRRARTDAERGVEPYGEMPGATAVTLTPGDAVFYDSNVLHRGVYKGIDGDGTGPGDQRFTLHGSVGLREEEGSAGEKGKARARVVLQHGVGEWAATRGFEGVFGTGEESERIERRAEDMRARLVEMGTGRGIGFSLQG